MGGYSGWGQRLRWWWSRWTPVLRSEQRWRWLIMKATTNLSKGDDLMMIFHDSPSLPATCAVSQKGPTGTSGSGQGSPAGRTLAPPPDSVRCQRARARASPSPPCPGTSAREPGSSAAGSKAPGRARRCPSSRGPAWRQPRNPPEDWQLIIFSLAMTVRGYILSSRKAQSLIVIFVSCCFKA